ALQDMGGGGYGTELDNEWHVDASQWDGRYFPGLGQRVKDEDARRLAGALERALPDIPDHEVFDRTPALLEPDNSPRTSPFEFYSGAWKEAVRDIVGHCRNGGGFWIWSYDSGGQLYRPPAGCGVSVTSTVRWQWRRFFVGRCRNCGEEFWIYKSPRRGR